mgnify:CR=1 FL=1
MSEDNSTKAITGAQSGGLNIIVVALLLLLAVVLGWYIGSEKPRGKFYFPPESGVLHYYMSVNEQGIPLPYTPEGDVWPKCDDDQVCPDPDIIVSDPSREELENISGSYYSVHDVRNEKASDKVATEIPGISSAYASDGKCGYIRVNYNGHIVKRKNPNDPDCW